MFGDPVTNPMGWEESILQSSIRSEVLTGNDALLVASLKTTEIFGLEGFKVSEQKHVIYNDFDIGCISLRLTTSGFRLLSAVARTSPKGSTSRYLHSGTFGCIGNCGESLAGRRIRPSTQQINICARRVRIAQLCFSRVFWVGSELVRATGASTNSMKDWNEKHANPAFSEKFPFPVPPLGHSNIVSPPSSNPSNSQKASQRAHLAELDTLFASLQSRAFRGDL